MHFGFRNMNINTLSIVWWVVLPIEAIIVVTISSVWRMLSFKETHLNERLSLLTLIIIGEGIIGVTKTVGKLWPGDEAPNGGSVITILAIVILMVCIFSPNLMPITHHLNRYSCGKHTLTTIHTATMGQSDNNGGLSSTSSSISDMSESSRVPTRWQPSIQPSGKSPAFGLKC